MKVKALKCAFPYTVPIFAGFWFLGLSYGIYMNVSGFSFVYPMIMSMVIFGGSLEFVTVSMLLSPFAPVQVFVMALLIQARHIFYGISMLDKYKGLGWKKLYLIFGLCDETFTINYTAQIPADVDRGWFMFFVTALNQFYWVSGSTIGGLVGSLLKFNTDGISFVMTAMFTVIFVDQWTKEKKHYASCIGIVASVVCLIIFGSDSFMLPTMATIIALLTLFRKAFEKSEVKYMSITKQIITVALCAFATMITRFLPFAVFSEKRKTPEFIQYIGKYLPSAIFGMLVVYCLKDVDFLHGYHGIPEGISIAITTILHLIKKNMLLSIAGGTAAYILLTHFVFI